MRHCEVCNKGSVIRGKRKLLRGHYNPVNYERKYPNLQWGKVNGVRTLMCVQCMKTMARKTAVTVK